jgi:hypothetical protein
MPAKPLARALRNQFRLRSLEIIGFRPDEKFRQTRVSDVNGHVN